MINQFDSSVNKDVLFNIKTGRKASPDAEKYLLSVISEGERRRDEFMKECQDNPVRFEKSISKTKIVNFATESFNKKNKSKKATEIVQLKGTRDLFARLLYLAVAKKGLEDELVITFPLSPEPAEFAHPDGTIRSTNKSSVVDIFDLVKTGPKVIDNAIETL